MIQTHLTAQALTTRSLLDNSTELKVVSNILHRVNYADSTVRLFIDNYSTSMSVHCVNGYTNVLFNVNDTIVTDEGNGDVTIHLGKDLINSSTLDSTINHYVIPVSLMFSGSIIDDRTILINASVLREITNDISTVTYNNTQPILDYTDTSPITLDVPSLSSFTQYTSSQTSITDDGNLNEV